MAREEVKSRSRFGWVYRCFMGCTLTEGGKNENDVDGASILDGSTSKKRRDSGLLDECKHLANASDGRY